MSAVTVGTSVVWRWRDLGPGKVIEVMPGCNALYRVEFDSGYVALLPGQDLQLQDGRKLSELPTNGS